jgi:hypothetical protein
MYNELNLSEHNVKSIYTLVISSAFFYSDWLKDTRLCEIDEDWDEDDEDSVPNLEAWDHLVLRANNAAEAAGLCPERSSRVLDAVDVAWWAFGKDEPKYIERLIAVMSEKKEAA